MRYTLTQTRLPPLE